jgi:hypothetical protein
LPSGAGAGDRAARAIDAHLDADAIDDDHLRPPATREAAEFHDGLACPATPCAGSPSYPSRRVVLLVEEKMRILDRNYGVRQMTDALKPWRGLLEVIVELQFHPQNNYVGVPLIDVLLVPLDGAGPPMPLVPEGTDRRPRFGLFWIHRPWARRGLFPPSIPVIAAASADRRLAARALRRRPARPRPLRGRGKTAAPWARARSTRAPALHGGPGTSGLQTAGQDTLSRAPSPGSRAAMCHNPRAPPARAVALPVPRLQLPRFIAVGGVLLTPGVGRRWPPCVAARRLHLGVGGVCDRPHHLDTVDFSTFGQPILLLIRRAAWAMTMSTVLVAALGRSVTLQERLTLQEALNAGHGRSRAVCRHGAGSRWPSS